MIQGAVVSYGAGGDCNEPCSAENISVFFAPRNRHSQGTPESAAGYSQRKLISAHQDSCG